MIKVGFYGCLALTLLLCVYAKQAKAQVLVLNNSESYYTVGYPKYLIDPYANLKIEQVATRNFKHSEFPTVSLGATRAAVWLKIKILNCSDKEKWYFQIDNPPVLQCLTIYEKQANEWVKIFTTDANPYQSYEQVKANKLLIPISIPLNKPGDYCLSATSRNFLRIPLKVTSLSASFEQSYWPDLLNGLTFGMLMAFAIYNLLVYVLTKEPSYLYYLLHLFFWSLNLFFYNGFFPDLPRSFSWLNSAASILALTSLSSILFTNSFLTTQKNSPLFYRVRWLMSFLSLVILFTDLYWDGAQAFILVQYFMYPFFVYWIGAGIQSLKNGYQPALYFVLGFGGLMLGNILHILKDLNLLPDNVFMQTSMHWGILLEALTLSFALASRLNFYQKEQEHIQLESIKEKKNFLRKLLHQQEEEKKRVAMELHDNIGQQLILIKNKAWQLQQLADEPLKNGIDVSISSISSIMTEVRHILQQLRPYQIDLLGLTQSLCSLLDETLEGHVIVKVKIDDINPFFDTTESIHIFRIIQQLVVHFSEVLSPTKICYECSYGTHHVRLKFDVEAALPPFIDNAEIGNRLELLNGDLSIEVNPKFTSIRISFPIVDQGR